MTAEEERLTGEIARLNGMILKIGVALRRPVRVESEDRCSRCFYGTSGVLLNTCEDCMEDDRDRDETGVREAQRLVSAALCGKGPSDPG